ncbi:glycoside hydrolase family 16 protein [Gelatoporia subvermispora B]|uniref:Glycoside hydrolase family 16 protein n=1 Tax=Ceriporiopsis subvermispora (strain B) TaxID=914234 RepID=M2PXD9_CERS8|nr:glycoside hydrolase family 16 protein [Gelatoporia subvermispora B]
MYLHVPLLVHLLANVVPSDASLLARGSESVIQTANRVRHNAVRRSTGFIRDLRLAYSGLLVQQTGGDVQCVNTKSGTSLTNGSGQGALGGNASSLNSSAVTVSSPTQTGTASSNIAGAQPTSSSSGDANASPWTLVQTYQGNTFFDGWAFQTGPDVSTGGVVTYIDLPTSQGANITEINSSGNAVMRVETTPQVASSRQSIRITTTYTYSGGLVIMDSVHMPTGCGTWPAFWSNGPNWPAGGEIDIVEGVHTYTNDQVTLHTNPGCDLPSTSTAALGISGTILDGTDCSVAGTGNAGCGIRATASNTFGAGFNSNDGGVYAMQWDSNGISVFFFPRNSIPSDITANAPQPSTWGQPIANFPASSCNPSEFFYSHSAIFDTTLCGAWAGAVWNDSGAPGQEQSCAQMTGAATCEDYVLNNGAAFDEAYWEVSSVKIYQSSS